MKNIGRLLICAAFALGACTSDIDDDSDQPLPEETAPVALPPDPGAAGITTIDATLAEWTVTLSRDSIPAGPVMINVRNSGTMPHAFEVEVGGQEFSSGEIPPGADVSMSLDIPAGTYKVYCPVEGGGTTHESRGMTTRLRVY